jgi:hypothetical protein
VNSSPLPAALPRVLVLGFAGLVVAGSAVADDELVVLREQVARQQALIERQEERLREQERKINELASRLGVAGVTPASIPASSATAAAHGDSAQEVSEPAAPSLPRPVVHSRFDGIDVTLAGALRTTVTSTTARMQPDATPFLVLPDTGGAQGTTKIDARLSSILISISGAQVGSFRLGGSIYAYLFNGDLFSGAYGFYPGFAYIDATSERWRVALGLQQDVFSPLMPGMVDRMSALAGSGNPGNSFKPQVRVERFIRSGDSRVVLQGALSDAVPSNINPNGLLSSTENTGTPNLEARVAFERGDAEADGAWLPWPRIDLGVSAVRGSIRTFSSSGAFPTFENHLGGVALEGQWRMGPRFGVQGEIYQGRALGTYLGTVFQTVNYQSRRSIDSRGGWLEAAYYWSPQFHSHTGYGIDSARSGDLAGSGLHTMQTAFTNLLWDPSRKTTLGAELTWRRTGYASPLEGQPSGYALMLSSELRF